MGRITEHYNKFNSWFRDNNTIYIYDELSKNHKEGKGGDLSSKKNVKRIHS